MRHLTCDFNSGEMGDLVSTGQDEKVKLRLETRLENIYKPGGKIALLKNVQNLSGDAASLFLTFGKDWSTWRFKGTILLMTMEITLDRSQAYQRLVNDENELNAFIKKHLTDLWKNSLGLDYLIQILLPYFTKNVLIFN